MHSFFKKNFNYYINIFFILSIWFCIDTNFENILSLKSDIGIKNIFLSLRALGPFIVFFIVFFYKGKVQLLTKNKSLNYILIILYINFLFQSIGLIVTGNSINNFYYILISLFSIYSISSLYNSDLNKINYLISLIVLTLIVCAFGYLSYEWFFTTRNINMYGTFPNVFSPLADFSSNVIRSSGLSRSIMIITIPLFYLILIDKIKLFYFIPYSRLFYLFPYLILSSMIYFNQSRIVIVFFVLFSFFSIFYFLRNKTINYKIKKIFILIILPIIFLYSLIVVKEEYHSKFYTNETIKLIVNIYNDNFKTSPTQLNQMQESGFALPHNDKEYFEVKLKNKELHAFFRKSTSIENDSFKDSFATRRYSFWKEVILESKKKVFGYGALGDRYLINENSSNTLVYSYASGGIISTIIMLIVIIRYTYLCLFFVFKRKISLQKKNIFIFSSVFTISFLLFRGIAEVGIAVFSIDLLIFLSCITICEKFKIQK